MWLILKGTKKFGFGQIKKSDNNRISSAQNIKKNNFFGTVIASTRMQFYLY